MKDIKTPSVRERNARILSTILAVLVGFSLCLAISYYHPFFQGPNPRSLRLTQTDYPLINPLLLCNVNQVNAQEDTVLEDKIKNYINTAVAQGKADKISLYSVEYDSAKYIGVNENDQYDPASLLKVPLMIAYYQLAEKNPSLLSQTTSFTGDDQNVGEFYKSSHDIQPGVLYSIDALIKNMIQYSDNTATTLLLNYVDKASFAHIYSDLGFTVPLNDPSSQSISVKSYSYFFRVLYNGTYLSHIDSEKALELLSRPDFPDGIRGGVPAGVTVAQKFGERSVYDQNNVLTDRELHDCGIVYKPGNTYMLCIMTRGADFTQLASTIQGLSSLVYTNIGQK